MRKVYYKLTDNSYDVFDTNSNSLLLQESLPFGIEYRKSCSCQLTQEQINNWWNYVDILLQEHPNSNFKSIWRIEENETIFGYENLNN
jgi:hypothetical protein